MSKGADCAAGFANTVYARAAQYFSERFWLYTTLSGDLVSIAADRAKEDVYSRFGAYFGMDSYSSIGDTRLMPAAYGE